MLAVKGVYENGIARPLEKVPGRRKREVIITFVDEYASESFEGQMERYVMSAMEKAAFEKLGDGSFSGTIPGCLGVVAFADSLVTCQRELEAVLRDWVQVKRKRKVSVPVISGIDLNGISQ